MEASRSSKILPSGPADTKAQTSLATQGAGRPTPAIREGGCPGGAGSSQKIKRRAELPTLKAKCGCALQRGSVFTSSYFSRITSLVDTLSPPVSPIIPSLFLSPPFSLLSPSVIKTRNVP